MSFSATITRSWNENLLMSALVELTYDCNLDCTFCYNDRAVEGRRLELYQYYRLLDDLASLNVLNLSFSGGEPLAHPRFFEIAGHARQLGFVVRVKTNGHALKEHVARRMREEVDPFLIEVSLHGATELTHDRQTRVPGSFERLVRNIRSMRELGLRVRANSILTRWNEHEVEEIYALCEGLGVHVNVDPDVKPRDNGDMSPLAIEATATGRARYQRALDERSNRQVAPREVARPASDVHSPTEKQCGAGSSSVAIDPYGNVLPCVQWRVPIGTLHGQSIAEIWMGSPRLKEIRETNRAARLRIRTRGVSGKQARFCPGLAHIYQGDPLGTYPAVEQRVRESASKKRRLTVV